MFKKIRRHKKRPAYQSFETGIIYELFKGGFAWPQNNLPGFICIIGQESEEGVLRVLMENHENSLTDFAKRCATLQDLYNFSGWTAQTEGDYKSYEDTLYKFARADDLSIYVSQPSIAWDLNLAVQIIRREMRQNTVLLPKNGILQTQMEKINREASLTEPDKLEKYTPIMVLASVVNEFDSLPERLAGNRPKDGYPEFFEDDEPVGFNIW